MNALASGGWLTRERVYMVAGMTGLATIALIAWLYIYSNGTLDALNRPLGTDFSNVWTAGKMALDGRAAEVWLWDQHFAVQRQFHGRHDIHIFGWHYPPPFLLIASALATLPYLPALLVWQLATLIPFAFVMARLVPRRDTWLLVLAAPVTMVCLTHGHNGFLTALLLGGGLALLDKRPLLAGILFGCLIYKPQFALIIPPLLLAGRHWRAIGGACLSAGVLIAATLMIWGWPVWQAFIESLPLTRTVIIEQGITGWEKIMTPFAAVRMWGGAVPLAYAIQALFTAAAVAAVVWLGWRRREPELRNALVCAATLLSTPYALDYDYVVLLPALAFLWRDAQRNGALPYDYSLMALVWMVPLFARTLAQATAVPLGLISVLFVALIAIRRMRARTSRHRHPAIDVERLPGDVAGLPAR